MEGEGLKARKKGSAYIFICRFVVEWDDCNYTLWNRKKVVLDSEIYI